jgi:hypothetical protein
LPILTRQQPHWVDVKPAGSHFPRLLSDLQKVRLELESFKPSTRWTADEALGKLELRKQSNDFCVGDKRSQICAEDQF